MIICVVCPSPLFIRDNTKMKGYCAVFMRRQIFFEIELHFILLRLPIHAIVAVKTVCFPINFNPYEYVETTLAIHLCGKSTHLSLDDVGTTRPRWPG